MQPRKLRVIRWLIHPQGIASQARSSAMAMLR
jgi:hypothetical protein